MIATCPTKEALEYLSVEWSIYKHKWQDVEIGTSILMVKYPTIVERIMKGVDHQTKEYKNLSI